MLKFLLRLLLPLAFCFASSRKLGSLVLFAGVGLPLLLCLLFPEMTSLEETRIDLK